MAYVSYERPIEAGFSVHSSNQTQITVKRNPDDHRFVFKVANERGRRVLSPDVQIMDGAKAKTGAATFTAEARAFAESEARKRGLIV